MAADLGSVGSGGGQVLYATPGTFYWVCPVGVTSISVVCVGGGGTRGLAFDGIDTFTSTGGGGGALAYVNNITVTPGNSYNVVVGDYAADSSFNTTTVSAGAGQNGASTGGGTGAPGGAGGVVVAGSGGAGGAGGYGYPTTTLAYRGAGGGAGGYSGAGGDAGSLTGAGFAGTGGGGGGGYGTAGGQANRGGGVGVLGQGASGAAQASDLSGNPGSGGSGIQYGGGGAYDLVPGAGAVRIIWPGTTRSFPSTNTGNL